MEASITGAGLILAIYALIVPMSHRIFVEMDKELTAMKMKFEKIRTTLTPESTDKEMKQLNSLIKEIKSMSKFPSDLGIGVVFTFSVYFVSILFDSLQLVNPSSTSSQTFVLGGLFIVATVSFFFVGGNAILRIYSSMKKEFDEITKKQKELASNSVLR
jgi:uncharacterized protein (DUF2225 family)